jgi:Putative zinc-finger
MAESPDHVTCLEVVEHVTDYLEDELAPEAVEVLEQHVNLCLGCESYIEQMRIAIETVGRGRERDVPADTMDRLLAAFRRRRGA